MSVRTIDPDVARCRAAVAGLTAQGADQKTLNEARRELEKAKAVAAGRAIVANPPPLPPDVFTSVVAALAGAVVTGD